MVWILLTQNCKGAAAQDRQTSLLPSQKPRLCHLFPFPIQWHRSVCLHVDAQAETCRCQEKAGLVSLSIHSSPCMEKTRHKSLHGSFFPPQLGCELTSHNQLLEFGSLSAMGMGLFSPFAPQHSAQVPAASPRAHLTGAWLSYCIRVCKSVQTSLGLSWSGCKSSLGCSFARTLPLVTPSTDWAYALMKIKGCAMKHKVTLKNLDAP